MGMVWNQAKLIDFLQCQLSCDEAKLSHINQNQRFQNKTAFQMSEEWFPTISEECSIIFYVCLVFCTRIGVTNQKKRFNKQMNMPHFPLRDGPNCQRTIGQGHHKWTTNRTHVEARVKDSGYQNLIAPTDTFHWLRNKDGWWKTVFFAIPRFLFFPNKKWSGEVLNG